MIKATIFKSETLYLKIIFDIYLPKEVQKHPEVVNFLSQIRAITKTKILKEGDDIAGFIVPIEDWMSIIGEILPTKCNFQEVFFSELVQDLENSTEKNLDVNFHQKPFDSPERYWLFILNQGYFMEYFLNRLYWYLGPKRSIVTPFPLHVDVETANTCNMKCPMCYRDQIKEIGQMDFDVFKKTVDECSAKNIFSLRLSWRGEPLTHPSIKEMISYATAKIKNVSFLTNAFFITDDIIECLIEKQVSYISVSFDGIEEIYETVRYPASYKENRRRILHLRDKREKAGSSRPQVRLCTVWPAIKDNPQAYADAMRPVSDYMVYNPYINFMGPMKLKQNFICQYPWERMVVAWNGNAQCCTGWNADDIILGNIKEKSLQEMWQGNLMNNIRKLHATGHRMEMNSCANCRHGCEYDRDASIYEIIERRF
jgi:radical SAM protein with 4Fe4S-binding SPASM domain